jgi:glucuronoarabinoxylan endo-1,4-beta-xylanase
MRNILRNLVGNKNKLLIFLSFYLTIFYFETDAQSLFVEGRVTSSRFPVMDASVTFIDNADTTRKFTALTNTSGNYQINIIITSVEQGSDLPTKFKLEQNYPNPFSSSTAIPYGLNEESNVQVTVYDILGRVVRNLDVGRQSVGTYNVLWDGRNEHGQIVASGIYFYKLHADGESLVKKMIFNQNGNGFILQPHSFSSTKNSNSTKSNPKNRSDKIQSVQGNTFTIQVQNTSTTTPLVVPQEIENVVIQNDTTINFSVAYIPVATVDFDSLHQIIRGFGAANILPWRPDMTDSEIETSFGTGDGQLGFTILRLMIQSDTNQWSMNVSTAKKAYDMGVLVFASPWNAPASMAETVDGQTRVRYDMYVEYAEHLNSFNTYMTNNSVPIYAVSVQNEPDFAEDWTGWTPDEMFTFMRENAHAIETRVMAPESFQFRHNMSDPILNDSVASANLDIVGGHIYGGGLASYPLAEQKEKEIWMTEHLSGENSQANDWVWAMEVAEEMNDVMKAGMSAYVWWYMVRYYGPISDGTENSGSKGDVTKKGYVMSQFARFIRPGFYRVESKVAPSLSPVDVTAYIDPSSSKIVIVAVNSGSTQVENVFRIENGNIPINFTPYTTSEVKNCEQGDLFNVADSSFTFTLDASSITTFVSD